MGEQRCGEADGELEQPAERRVVAEAVTAGREDHEVGLAADGGGEGAGGAEHEHEHHLPVGRARHVDLAQHRVKDDDGRAVGDDARE
eukprot:2911697-Prymnesium_polylepis.1